MTDLPQPLAGAELGWALDARKLFIGNGAVADGAPVVGNTEILTQFSDLINLPNQYTYKGAAGGYIVQTGPDSDNPVAQTVQSRLDSYAIVTDFGAVGDGITDCTEAINRALFQLYCRAGNNPAVRRGLFFPAGQYLITNTLNIPTWASLYGDGLDASIVFLAKQEWNNALPYQAYTTVFRDANYYLSIQNVPAGTSLGDTAYWSESVAPTAVIRTADSNFNIGSSIGLDGGIAPDAISISNIKFVSEYDSFSAVLLQDATDCVFSGVAIQGPMTETIITDAVAAGTLPDISAVTWSSTPALVCQNITFENCQFSGFSYGTKTAQQIKTITIRGSEFDTLYQGVVLGGATPVLGGPTGVRIIDNAFDNIYAQGIMIENVELNATGYNIFYDVGNHFNGVSSPETTIIDIDAENNISVGDLFARTTAVAESSGLPRINLNNRVNVALDNAYQLELGTYHRRSGLQATLLDNSTNATLFTIDSAVVRAFAFDYTVVRNTGVRSGRFTVTASTDGNNATMIWTDSGSDNGSSGVTFAANENLGTITVTYSTTAIAVDADIYYSVTKLA